MRLVLRPGSGVTIPVAVDHAQFIACDPEAELEIETYDKQAMRDGLAVWPGGVTVSPQATGPQRRSASYALLVCGSGFDTINDFDEDGADAYALWLWPGPELERRVLRDGFAWIDRRPFE